MFSDAAYTNLMNLVWWLGFTPLQGHVLKALIIILVVNFILITVSWHVYAQRISHTLSFSKFASLSWSFFYGAAASDFFYHLVK